MTLDRPAHVVHLELHTNDLAAARAFYAELLSWRTEPIDVHGARYHALDLGGPLDGGIVECGTPSSRWLPYVQVDEIAATTARGCELGASLLLAPREGRTGWRSVLVTPAGAEIALWQPKRRFGSLGG